MTQDSVIQFGMKPAAMGATSYRCVGGPADGQELALCDGDVMVIARQPAGVNPGDPFLAVSVSPVVLNSLRTYETYRGEYELRDGQLHWTDEHRPNVSEDPTHAE